MATERQPRRSQDPKPTERRPRADRRKPQGRLRELSASLRAGAAPSRSKGIQSLVDGGRDRLDLRTKVFLDLVQIETIVVRDQVDREAEVTETARPADAMQVRLRALREIEVDDDCAGEMERRM